METNEVGGNLIQRPDFFAAPQRARTLHLFQEFQALPRAPPAPQIVRCLSSRRCLQGSRYSCWIPMRRYLTGNLMKLRPELRGRGATRIAQIPGAAGPLAILAI